MYNPQEFTPIILEELSTGDLKMSLNPKNTDAREDVQYLYDFRSSGGSALWDLLENSRYIGNDWHEVQPAEIGALTDAPIIGYRAQYDSEDSQQPDRYEKIWWFPNYQVEDFLETLLKDGAVIFTKAD